MSNSDIKQAPKGPSVTAKGVMPKSHLSRWGSSNLLFPAERGRKGKETKVATQDWKLLILLQRKLTTYRRLPANMRGALVDLMTPLSREVGQGYANRRDKTGGETGEIVAGGIAS